MTLTTCLRQFDSGSAKSTASHTGVLARCAGRPSLWANALILIVIGCSVLGSSNGAAADDSPPPRSGLRSHRDLTKERSPHAVGPSARAEAHSMATSRAVGRVSPPVLPVGTRRSAAFPGRKAALRRATATEVTEARRLIEVDGYTVKSVAQSLRVSRNELRAQLIRSGWRPKKAEAPEP